MLIKMKYVIHICMFNSCSILTSMEANEIEILKRTIEQLSNKVIILEERIITLEHEKYRHVCSPSFLIGDTFMLPREN